MKIQDGQSPVRKILVAGDWVTSDSSIEVRSPYSGVSLASVASANAELVEKSIEAAVVAAEKMRSIPRFRLSKALRFIASEIERRKDQFVETIIAEAAKPAIYARGEVERAISTFSFAAGEAERFTGEIVAVDAQAGGLGKWARTVRVPRGVIYGITPFNFPLNLVAHKVAPALASGNAIVVKPSPRTPLTALLLAEVVAECGLPESALQVVPTDVGNVDMYLRDDRIAMISFTGSAAVGWDLKDKAGKKAVALELGGSAPVIVDSTANIEKSIARCVTGAFAYSGQVCISVQRIYVQARIFPDWISGFVDQTRNLKRGDPASEDTQVSVMIDEAAAIRAENWIREAADHGAKVLIGGQREGNFLEPTVLTKTDPEMKIVVEEAFAPVAVVESYNEIQDAVQMANLGKYGLQAGIFSSDANTIEFAAANLEYGGVIVNDAPIFRVDNMPYGGTKDSGLGREGVRFAMEEMSERKLIVYSDFGL